MGSRYGGLKQLDPVGPNQEVILDYSIFDALKAGFDKVIFVIRQEFKDAFEEQIISRFNEKVNHRFAFQEINPKIEGLPYPERTKPWGTAHAVLAAIDHIEEPFAVINADDYYGRDGYEKMANFLKKECSSSLQNMIGYRLGNTLSESGHVNRGICEVDEAGNLVKVVETLRIKKEGGKVSFDTDGGRSYLNENQVVSMNFWGFHPDFMQELKEGFRKFVAENIGNAKAEYYIPLIVDDLINSSKCSFRVLQSADRWYGVTYKEDKSFVTAALNELHEKGVYPDKLW